MPEDRHLISLLESALPGWHIDRLIGEGTYGSVYHATNQDLGVVAAVKVIPSPQDADEMRDIELSCNGSEALIEAKCKERIQELISREVNALKRCRSLRNVVNLYKYAVVQDGQYRQQRYLVVCMELLSPLLDYLKGRSEADVMKMVAQIAHALSQMQKMGMMHRDIKPSNIMVDAYGTYKLIDFGTARAMGGKTVVGTPYYMAPEVNGGVYDVRADIYSLGITAYYILNQNRYPFQQGGGDKQAAFQQRKKGAKAPPIPGVSAGVNRILLRCVEYLPENRYSTAEELEQDALAFLQNANAGSWTPPETAPPPAPEAQLPRGAQAGVKNPARFACIAAAAVVALALTASVMRTPMPRIHSASSKTSEIWQLMELFGFGDAALTVNGEDCLNHNGALRATDTITIKWSFSGQKESGAEYEWEISGADGLVAQGLGAPDREITLNASELESGDYTISVRKSGGSETLKGRFTLSSD